MKKDKKFLEELESYLQKSRYKDEIIKKYDNIIKEEKASGKRIKYIIQDLGNPKDIADLELKYYKETNSSNIFETLKDKFASIKENIKNKKKAKKEAKKEPKKKSKKNTKKNKSNIFSSIKGIFTLNTNKKSTNKKEKKTKKDNKVKKEKTSFKDKLSKFKNFVTKDLTKKKERPVTDSPKEIVEEIKEEFEENVSDVAEIVPETHIFESKEKRIKRIVLKTLGVLFTILLVFIWLWVTVVFFASLFAYLDGIKFKGIILTLFAIDLLVLWIVIMINRTMFKRKMSVKLNIIICIVLVTVIAFGIVLSYREISKIQNVQDVSEKYTMTRKLETYDLPKESNEKFIITFNSNYNTQYVIKHDKNIKGKVKIEVKYYECYYDYYVKTNTEGVYVSLKLDDRDRFSVYLDDIKEGKIYDNDELSRYTVKITVNPDEANKIAVQ